MPYRFKRTKVRFEKNTILLSNIGKFAKIEKCCRMPSASAEENKISL
jgi:hypothetical protein